MKMGRRRLGRRAGQGFPKQRGCQEKLCRPRLSDGCESVLPLRARLSNLGTALF